MLVSVRGNAARDIRRCVTLQLHSKGRLEVGACADVVVLAEATTEPKYVVAKGVVVKAPGWVRGGCFERGEGIRPCPVPALNGAAVPDPVQQARRP